MQAVILAAGRGTRLEPVTDHVLKPLIPFWGKPFLEYLLDVVEPVADEAIIVTPPDDRIPSALGTRHGRLPLRYAVQPTPLGTGDALLQAREMLEDSFLLLLGDTLPRRETLQGLIETSAQAVLTVIEVTDPENHVGVSLDEERRVIGLWTEAATVDAGVFRLGSAVLASLSGQAPRGGELRILQGVARMLEAKQDVRAVHMPGPWLQFGDHEGLSGIMRVMHHLAEMQSIDAGPDAASVMLKTRNCHIVNSLVFGPGSLTDCIIRDSLLYCAVDAAGLSMTNEIAALV